MDHKKAQLNLRAGTLYGHTCMCTSMSAGMCMFVCVCDTKFIELQNLDLPLVKT